jgi:hypothetical protein
MSSSAEYWYVTKYALSDGIREILREQCQLDDKWLWWNQPDNKPRELFRKGEFFETKAEAKARAVAMAQKRIATSQKAIAKMENLIAGWGETDAENALAELEDSL